MNLEEESPDSPQRDVGPREEDLSVKEDWRVGDEVWVRRVMGGSTPSASSEVATGYEYYSGIIAYTGSVSFADGDDWVGIRLTGNSAGKGRNDGSVQAIRYFSAPPFSGLFVRTSALRLRAQKSPVRPTAMMRTPPPVSSAQRPPRNSAVDAPPSSLSSSLSAKKNGKNAMANSPDTTIMTKASVMERTPLPNKPDPPNNSIITSRQSSKESAGFRDVLAAETKSPTKSKKKATNGKSPKVSIATGAPATKPSLASKKVTPKQATTKSVFTNTASLSEETAAANSVSTKPAAKPPAAKPSFTIETANSATETNNKAKPATVAAAAATAPKVSPTKTASKTRKSKATKGRDMTQERETQVLTPTPRASSNEILAPTEQEQDEIMWTPPPNLGPLDLGHTRNQRQTTIDNNNDNDDDKFYWSLSQQRWVRFMLGLAIVGLWVLTGLILGLDLEGTDDQDEIPSNSTTMTTDNLYDTMHIRPLATPLAQAWLPASLLLLLSLVAGILRLPLCQTPRHCPVSALAAYTSRLSALVTGLCSLVMLVYIVVFTFMVNDDSAQFESVLHVERWVIWLLVDVVVILLPSCVALMLSFYPGDESSAMLDESGADRDHPVNQSFQSEVVPLLSGTNDDGNENNDQEAGNYQLMTDEDDAGRNETPTTGRVRGSRRLLQLASSQVLYLYLGCAVLLLRLPFSLAIPHFVSTTLTALAKGDFGTAHGEILALTICGTIDAFLDFWCIFLFGYSNLRIVKALRLDLFQRLLNMEVAFFDAHHSGSLTSRLNTDCSAMSSDLTWFFRFSIESVVRIVGIAGYMLYRSRPLAGCALAIVPAVAIVNKIYGDWLARNAAAVQSALASTQTVAQEALAHIRTVIILGAEPQMFQSYRHRVLKHYNLNVRQTFWQGVYYMVVSTFLINTVVQAALLWVGAYLISNDQLTTDVLLAFMLYQGQLQGETMNLFQSYSSLIKSSGAGDQVFALLDRRTPPPGLGHGTVEEIQDDDASPSLAVTLERVTFRYPSRPEQVVLDNLDWKVAAGKTVALVGRSGSGKSTILSLIQRLYDPSAGRILVNGKDLRQKNLVHYRRQIGVVNQDCVLFDGTIFENVTFGYESQDEETEEAVEARVKGAAELANLSEFIGTLPLGYETQVGEGGTQLSGGQKQRLAIARAIYRDPALLILDEATSSLDQTSERLVQEALDRLLARRKGMTTIIVAHRLQTVQQSDSIYVLDKGKIAEQGTHKDLMRQRRLYYDMVGKAIQSKGVMDG